MNITIKKSLIISTTEKILIIFFSINAFNLINIILNSFGNLIFYEDSFSLLNLNNNSFFYWLFEPHNGHVIVLTKLLTFFFKEISISPTGFNILFSIIILFIGLIFIKKTVTIINPISKYNNLILLICSFFWISPWQWENLIWEFQLPWFLIVLFVMVLNYFNFYHIKFKTAKNTFFENLFLTISPIIAILSSGQGICYVNCLSISLLLNKRKNLFPIIGALMSYIIFISIKFLYKSNLEIDLNLLNLIGYIFFALSTIFKAPISAFNKSSNVQWVIPIITSLIFQFYLTGSILKSYIKNFDNKLYKFNYLIPILFGIQFLVLTSITRSQYGIHQGGVSRYLTCINLIPIGLIYVFHYLNSKKLLENKKLNILIEEKYFQFSSIITLCLILNLSSILLTTYQTPIVYKTRLNNFEIFRESCAFDFKNNVDLIRSNYSRFKTYHGVNIPPLPDANKFEIFKNYLNSDICEAVNQLN